MQSSRDTSQFQRQLRLKVKGWKMIIQANGIQRKAVVAVLISNEIDFKIKKTNERR